MVQLLMGNHHTVGPHELIGAVAAVSGRGLWAFGFSPSAVSDSDAVDGAIPTFSSTALVFSEAAGN